MSNQNLSDQSLLSKVPKFRFTIGSMMIMTTVLAAFSVSLSYYVKALWAEEPGTEIGMFAIVSAMIPTVFLVLASWFLKAASFVAKLLR